MKVERRTRDLTGTRAVFQTLVKWLIKSRQSVRLFKRGAMTATYLQLGGTWTSLDNQLKRPGRGFGRGIPASVRAFVLLNAGSSVDIGYGLFFQGIFFLAGTRPAPFFHLLRSLSLSFCSFSMLDRLNARDTMAGAIRSRHLQLGAICPALFTGNWHKVPLAS